MDRNDVYRTAKYLVDQYGTEANRKAAAGANKMYKTRDLEGLVMWKNIERAVSVLQKVAEESAS